MTTEKLLLSYSLDVKYWDEGFGETHLLWGHREALSEEPLTADQRVQLEQLDQIAEQKLANYRGEETTDVSTLRRVIETVIKPYRSKRAELPQAA